MLKNQVKSQKDLPGRSSLNPNNSYTPGYRTGRQQKSITYQSVKLWNEIPPELQKLYPQLFKIKLKKRLFTMK